jgi:hypothetical protein
MVRAVDLFAGAGGWSCGAESAGVRVVAGANHWPRVTLPRGSMPVVFEGRLAS